MYQLIENRQIRVFVSSTFQDMQAERNYLTSTIFPRLRKKAAERDVSFVGLDLRWGIPAEDAQNGKVVQICLNEIDNSHPFFIGLLGDRYGTTPSPAILEQDTNLVERYPWVKEDIARGISITEIEMQYGVLRREEDDLNACFLLKESGGSIDPKQQALREAVRSNMRYPYDDYTTVEELGEKVEKVFTELLERLFPQTELSGLELERLAQRAFLHSRCRVYIPNEANFERLNEFLADEQERYLVIAGESGMGKSALVANWLKKREKDDSYCTIYHFVGNSGSEGDYNRILSRLTDEIHDLYGIPKPDKMQAEQSGKEPKEILQELIMRVANRKPLLIVLDGINQLADKEGENPKLLNWLPSVPMGCKMLFSTLEDDATMATFRRREYPVFRLEPLDGAQRRQLIVDYLYTCGGKRLKPEQVARIADDPESHNTLVLRTLLDELLCFGIHEKLDARIDYYLSAESIGDFFRRVLQRAEEDYGRELVRDTLALVAVSHDGMGETELLDMAHLLPLHWSAFYCAFAAHFTVKNGLVNFSHSYIRNAVVTRYLDAQTEPAFRRRVIDYFTNSGEFAERKKNLFRRVINYLTNSTEAATCEQKSKDNTRAWSELVHQYCCVRMNKALHTLVLRPEVFDYFYKKNVERLVSVWQQLRVDGSEKYSLDDYLADKHENGKPEYYFDVGYFSEEYFKEFSTTGNAYNKALTLYRRLAVQNSDVFDSDVATTLNNLGNLHKDLQAYETAEKECREALEIRRRLAAQNPDAFDSDVADTLNNLGVLHQNLHAYETAEKEYREALEIRRRLAAQNPDAFDSNVAMTLNNLGALHQNLQAYETAEKECREALEIYRRLAAQNPDAFDSYVATTLCNLGVLHYNLQAYGTAEKEYREALEIRRRLAALNPDAFDSYVADTLNNLGVLHCKTKYYRAAEKELREALKIRRHLAAKNPKNPAAFDSDVANTLNNLGVLHKNLHDYKSAEKEYREALKIYRRLAVKNLEVANTLYRLTVLYYIRMQQYSEAEKCGKEALEIYRRLAEKKPDVFDSDVAIMLNNLGELHYWKLQDYGTAENEYREALEIYRRLAAKNPDKFDLYVADTLNNLGILHKNSQNYETAKQEYREVLEIYRRLAAKNPDKFDLYVADTLNNLGILHKNLQDYELAKKELCEA